MHMSTGIQTTTVCLSDSIDVVMCSSRSVTSA